MAKQTTSKGVKKVNIDAVSVEMGKVPPQAIDIEEIVLGALLLEPNIVADVLHSLHSDCFYKEANRKIFNVISELSLKHAPVDLFTVSEELKKRGDLEMVGGAYYLGQLSSKIGAATHIDYHIKILLQKYMQRELITISYKIQKESFDDSMPVDDLLDSAQQDLFILTEKNVKREAQPIGDLMESALSEIESYKDRETGLSGIASGFLGIDRITLGWQKSDLIIVAARPSMGKTAFVLTMARNMAVTHNIPVAFFSLEMSSAQLVKRLIVSETGISSEKIKGGKRIENHEWAQILDQVEGLQAAPLYIDDTPSLSIYEFRSKARRLVRSAGVKMIIIDYLQLMSGPPELRGMREQEVSNISRSLKAIAKELDIPIIALSQLSRAVETRGGLKRPQLSDLRESGAIEQDADIVMFIHRPDYYGLQDDPTMQGLAEIIIAKHRNGEVTDVKMKFKKQEAKFYDYNDGDDSYLGLPVSKESRMNSSFSTGFNSDLSSNQDF